MGDLKSSFKLFFNQKLKSQVTQSSLRIVNCRETVVSEPQGGNHNNNTLLKPF